MKEFFSAKSLQILLRNFFSGIVFLISFGRSFGPESFATLRDYQLILAATALAAGVITYAIHRALLEPIIASIRYAFLGTTKTPLWSEAALNALKDRWLASKNDESWEQCFQKHLELWADYLHLLYTSFLAVMIGSAMAALYHPHQLAWAPDLVALALLLLVAAVVGDLRRHAVLNYLTSQLPTKSGSKQESSKNKNAAKEMTRTQATKRTRPRQQH